MFGVGAPEIFIVMVIVLFFGLVFYATVLNINRTLIKILRELRQLNGGQRQPKPPLTE